MSTFTLGDVVLRGSAERGFFVVDAITRKSLAGPIPDYRDAVAVANRLAENLGRVWQEPEDNRGRSLRDAYPLTNESDAHDHYQT